MPHGTPLQNMKRNRTGIADDETMLTAKKEEYPYGLRISLDDESIAKLGISKLPEVGLEMYLGATVKVVEVSENELHGENKERRVELQITDMALTVEKENPGKKIYGG